MIWQRFKQHFSFSCHWAHHIVHHQKKMSSLRHNPTPWTYIKTLKQLIFLLPLYQHLNHSHSLPIVLQRHCSKDSSLWSYSSIKWTKQKHLNTTVKNNTFVEASTEFQATLVLLLPLSALHCASQRTTKWKRKVKEKMNNIYPPIETMFFTWSSSEPRPNWYEFGGILERDGKLIQLLRWALTIRACGCNSWDARGSRRARAIATQPPHFASPLLTKLQAHR